MNLEGPLAHETNEAEIEHARDQIVALEKQIRDCRRSWTPFVLGAIGAALFWRSGSTHELILLGAMAAAALGALMKAVDATGLRCQLEGEKTRLALRLLQARDLPTFSLQSDNNYIGREP